MSKPEKSRRLSLSSSPNLKNSTNSSNLPIAGGIKVHLSSSTTSKDGDLWYKGCFDVILSNKKRYRVFSNKADWIGHQYNGVREKLQKHILSSAEASGLDTSSLLLEPLMSSDMPWELAWVSFENEVLKNKLESATKSSAKSSAATGGWKAKEATNNKMAWAIGSGFPSRQAKYNAKARVLLELESASGKELKKAESILSSIVFGLTKEPGFDEMSVLSDETRKKLLITEVYMLRTGLVMRSLA